MAVESNYNITNKAYQQKIHNTFKSSDKQDRKPNQQSKKNGGKSKSDSSQSLSSDKSKQKKGKSINKYF